MLEAAFGALARALAPLNRRLYLVFGHAYLQRALPGLLVAHAIGSAVLLVGFGYELWKYARAEAAAGVRREAERLRVRGLTAGAGAGAECAPVA